MARRRHVCDVPGCGRERSDGWQRLCTRCFGAMPVPLRDRILKGWKFDRAEWRAAKRDARKWLASFGTATDAGSVSAQQAYAANCRLTGERDWTEAAE